jgi:nucleoprotein TPR
VTELQDLLKEAGNRYGALEDHFENEKTEHKGEMKRRNDAIRALRKETSNANELIVNLKQKGLTDDGIANLSPAAAAASKLIKSGMSLTGVYSQLVSCQEELLAADDEKRRLNSYLEQILTDIEQRAPALKRQRDEYERAVSTVNQLTQQIGDIKEANLDESQAAEIFKRKYQVSVRDNERLGKQTKDLGDQVAVLLREVEAARFGRTTRQVVFILRFQYQYHPKAKVDCSDFLPSHLL